MADYVAHQVYENLPDYKGISDNLIDGTETINVQRWKYEAQVEWVRNNTTQEPESTPSIVSSAVATSGGTNSIQLDKLHSGNGSKLVSLKRMELVYGDLDVKFAVNPSDYTQKEPNRVTMTQTKGGAWIDAWGAGIVEFNIKGITGVYGKKFTATQDNYLTKVVNTTLDVARVLAGDSGVDVGYQRWKEMRDLFRTVYQAVEDGEPVEELIQFYNFTDNEYWYCYPAPAGIELYRSKSKPHVYQYTITLWGLRRIGEPQVSSGVIGNPNTVQATTNASTGVQVDTTPNSEAEVEGVTAEGQGFDDWDTLSQLPGELENEIAEATQTTANATQRVQGGTAYITKSAALNTQADITTITNTRTKTNEILRSQSKEYADLLAPIIGGTEDGLLVPTTAYNVATELSLTSVGGVLQVNAFDQNNFVKNPLITEIPDDRLIQEINFTPMVAAETYNLWKLIREYSPDVLADNLITPGDLTAKERIMKSVKTLKYYGSTLYEYIIQYKPKYYLTRTDIKYLKMVMIDVMSIFYQLYRIYLSTGQIRTSITLTNINTLIRNIQSLNLYLKFNSTDINVFYVQNVRWELRQLEATLHRIKTDIIEYL